VVRAAAHASPPRLTFPRVADRLRVAVVINPVAGVRATLERARARAELAMNVLLAQGVDAELHITERPGHARELSESAVERGVRVVVAWGGDGTVNEVASALVGTPAALAVIPSGSGNGLARMLGVPSDPARAIERFLHGSDHLIDVGVIDGHSFVNVAGVGFDAHVAAAFAAIGRARRGLLKYGSIVASELWRYESRVYEIALEAEGVTRPPITRAAFLLSFANGSQWGNGAIIAPDARLDDGLLDAVWVELEGPWAVLRALPHLFRGTLPAVTGVTIEKVRAAVVRGAVPLVYHADGEAFLGGTEIAVTVRQKSLRLRH
jgi:diacylglycerol kinase (ATP)